MNKHSHASANVVLVKDFDGTHYASPIVPEDCPACCHNEAEYLGQLGKLLHYRCCGCGWTFRANRNSKACWARCGMATQYAMSAHKPTTCSPGE